MVQSYDDVFGKDFETTATQKDGFDTLPSGSYVLATIKEAKPWTWPDGRVSVELISKTDRIGASTPAGNYGHPMFWDKKCFSLPEVPDPTLPEDERKKANSRAGFWAKRVGAVGVDRKSILPSSTADDVARLFLPSVGTQVIIKSSVKAASGDYPAKAVAYDYLPATAENLEKYGLDEPF